MFKSSALPYWLSAAVVVVAAFGAWRVWNTQFSHGNEASLTVGISPDELAEREPITEFTLDERNGQTFDSRAMAGQVWVVSYFFSNCPGSCLKLNQSLAKLQEEPSLAGVKFLSITCDPENDTPEVLREYADRFGAVADRWFFCTGDFAYLKRIGQDVLKLSVSKQQHSDRAVVIDRTGMVRGRFMVTDPNQYALLERSLASCLVEAGDGAE